MHPRELLQQDPAVFRFHADQGIGNILSGHGQKRASRYAK